MEKEAAEEEMRANREATECRLAAHMQSLDRTLVQCQGEVLALKDEVLAAKEAAKKTYKDMGTQVSVGMVNAETMTDTKPVKSVGCSPIEAFIKYDLENWAYCYGCTPAEFPKACKKCCVPLRYGPDAKVDKKVEEIAKQLAEMAKEMEDEKEDLKQMVDQASKAIKPKLPKGSQEALAIESLEAWKRKRLLQIEKRQRILEETYYVLKSVLAPAGYRAVEAAQQVVGSSPHRRTTIVSALHNINKKQHAAHLPQDPMDKAAMNRLLGARAMPQEVPFALKGLPSNAAQFSVVPPGWPNGGGQIINLNSLLPASEQAPRAKRGRNGNWSPMAESQSPRNGKRSPGIQVFSPDAGPQIVTSQWSLNGTCSVPMPPREPPAPRGTSIWESGWP